MKSNQEFLSPRKYIIQRAKSLPIMECLIETEYKEMGMSNVVIVRQEPGGKLTMGVFNVDLYCLGVKDAFCNCHLNQEDYEKITSVFQSGQMKISPAMAHNLIYGAIDYAESLGFSPHKDFAFAENVLDDTLIDDAIDEIEFGKNGIPVYVQGKYDNFRQVIKQLNKSVGEGNYEFVLFDDF